AWEMAGEADELDEEVEGRSLTDRTAQVVSFSLAELLMTARRGEPGREREERMLGIVRELARWRREDHEMQRRGIERERWELEKADRARTLKKEEEKEQSEQRLVTHLQANELAKAFLKGMAEGTISQEMGM